MVQNITRYGGSVGKHPLFIKDFMIRNQALNKRASNKEFQKASIALTSTQQEEFTKLAEDKALATAFMMGGNRKIFGPQLVNMQNQFLLDNDQMPDTLA